jgi:prolyl-tRNA editing enzyme YbaK/EbsC (Cys-tRNA(Pro) deacylase)
MNTALSATQRVAAAGQALGLDVAIREHAVPTRTAQEAAEACGVTVAQIVKSLVFRGAGSGRPVLLLVAGTNRVNEQQVADELGEALTRPDAAYVREVTGFAIGGIPPFGHATPLTTFIDRDLLVHEVVWAAAGTPNAVFAADPRALAKATQARVIAMC